MYKEIYLLKKLSFRQMCFICTLSSTDVKEKAVGMNLGW